VNINDDIFFVIVLYKCNLERSETINTLRDNLFSTTELFVFDNSPQALYNSSFFNFDKFIVTYKNDTSNPGLSEAYNQALKEASIKGKKWILLLDQDTFITKNYIEEIINLNIESLSKNIAAIIPKVRSNNNNKFLISPAKIYPGGFVKPISINSGISNKPITGINSGTILNVDFMNSINGFTQNFNLDMLDHWYFREIYTAQKKVFVLDSTINQSLSVSEYFEENISLERYKNMLFAESTFVKSLGNKHIVLYKIRLFYRLFKQIRFKNFEYFKITFHFIINRI
jgi:GT2 family glycosyltransferase